MNLEIDLLSADEDVFEAALVAAVKSGATGERKLLDALSSARDEERAAGIVSALGEAEGPDGVAVLRGIVAQPADPLEVRTTAIVALTKRQGVEASDVLLGCLIDWDDLMPGYALLGLASVGDDRAWPEVLQWLRQTLDSREPNPQHDFADRTLVAQSDIVAAVAYLARHAAGSWEKQQPVVQLLRSRWNRLRGAEQRWLTVNWSACDPAHPDSCTDLDPAWFADWISEPLFEALYLEDAE
ncbi:HEAT repeat domain-containing protein [Actinoplanes sp. NPDC049599]|uniref:HEAT repeat domain-containing protein n=1 Tax=Actinoplanes sp. NPDC049599 TaxID=3363903 RepID=UPI003788BACA